MSVKDTLALRYHPIYDAVVVVLEEKTKLQAYAKLKEISNDPRVVAQALNVWCAVKSGNRHACAPQNFEVYDVLKISD